MDTSPAPVPRDAATVLLLRERNRELEALLLQRHSAMSFMAGAWVFPGGALSPHDCGPAALARLVNVPASPQALRNTELAPLAPNIMGGLHVCACRETF